MTFSALNRFFSYTITETGISLITEESLLVEFPEFMLNMSHLPLTLHCIQIDLSNYEDRHGIVAALNQPLSMQGINALYLSTVRSANLLV
jgi:hypothetical protein